MDHPPNTLLRSSSDPSTFHTAVWGRVFNHRRDTCRTPFAACKPHTVEEVIAAVNLAIKNSCRVSVRSGGHSWAGWSVRHDAVLLDLCDLDSDGSTSDETFKSAVGEGEVQVRQGRIDYDERTKIVSCSPSTTGRMLNGFLAEVGRMFAGGHCPDVGMGGFLLQGGMGWNCKNWGWACESMIAIDVVTADAQQIHCSTVENPDLFWAARGAGPGFPAIVTRFYLQTRPLLQMFQSLYIFPVSEFKTVLQWEIDIAPTVDPSTEMVAVTSYIPLPSSPSTPVLTILANFTTFQPTRKQAISALSPIHASVPPNAEVSLFCQPTSFEKEYAHQSLTYPQRLRYCTDNIYLSNSTPSIPDILEESFTSLPGEKCCALWFAMNPTSRRDLGNMALSMQSDHYVALYGVWEEEGEDKRYEEWVGGMMKEMEGFAVGSYLGDADFRVRGLERGRFWGVEEGERVERVRRTWDKEGRICGFLDGEEDRLREHGVKGN